jgi:flagellar motor protein MotB
VTAEFFISHGIEAERIIYSGIGSSKLFSKDFSELERKKNQRVDILIIQP